MDPLEYDILKRLERVPANVDDLLGPDVLDQVGRSNLDVRLEERARVLAGRLRNPDPQVSKKAVESLAVLVNVNDRFDAATPTGVAMALTDHHRHDLLRQGDAARLLGTSRQRVNDLIRAGKLDRSLDRQVTRGSLARELHRRSETPWHVVERVGQDGRDLDEYLTDTGEWAPLPKARRFPTLRDARRVAGGRLNKSFARGVTKYPFGEAP